MALVYENPRQYIQSGTSLLEKIERIDALITAMEAAMLEAATGSDVSEYSLNDGQTQIRAVSRSPEEMVSSMMALEKLKQVYVNRFNGHVVQLKDARANRFKA